MGLDSVELVMALEEEFGLDIPDADAERLETVGGTHDYIVETLKQRGEAPDEAEVWQRLHRIIVNQLGVDPSEVRREAYFVRDLGCD